MKTISINPLSTASRENAIAQIDALIEKIHKLEKFKDYLQTLAEQGVVTAQSRFDEGVVYKSFIPDPKKGAKRPTGVHRTYVDNYTGVKVASKRTDNGFIITADGEQVLFMEFGAGVYWSGQAYPDERPEGIVGIGEYGDGHGKQKIWSYYAEDGTVRMTRGVPALAGMYYAKKQIMLEVEQKVKELLND